MVKKPKSGSGNTGSAPANPNVQQDTSTTLHPLAAHLGPLVKVEPAPGNSRDHEKAQTLAATYGRSNGHDNGTKKPPVVTDAVDVQQQEAAITAPSVVTVVTPIQKPDDDHDFLNKFRTKTSAALANVENNTDAVPHHRIVDAKDFVRLRPDPAYWSPELCFISVPIIGQKKDTLHLIDEELAMEYLPPGIIQRFRLALATKPYDVLFLCEVPTQNLDNKWNATNLQACEEAKTQWTMVTSRRLEGVENYKIDHARNPEAFPEPWQKPNLPSLGRFIRRTFNGAMIEDNKHPGLLRRIGEKLDLK